MTKIRDTLEQKCLKNRLQKEDNVKGAFAIELPELVAGRTLLLIDDIYDAGKMLQEIGRTASSREVFYGSSTIAAMVYDRRSVA